MKSEEKAKKKKLELDEKTIEKITNLIMREFRVERKDMEQKILTLRDMEKLVSKLSKKIHAAMLLEMVQDENIKLATQKKSCPECQTRLKYEGKRARTIHTMHGNLKISRHYYRCPSCSYSWYPEDEAFHITSGKLSSCLCELACLLALNTSYEEAALMIHMITGEEVTPDTIERSVKNVGSKLYDVELQKAEELYESRAEAEPSAEAPEGEMPQEERIYLQIDGSTVNTREGGWKENKLAIAYKESDVQKCGKDKEGRIRIKSKDFVSSIGQRRVNLIKFKKLLFGLLKRIGAFSAKEVVVIADGAVWIHSLVTKLLPNVVFILDWFHVTDHLGSCANELFGEKSKKGEKWIARYKELIWDGKISEALSSLLSEANGAKKQTPLRKLYAYLNRRKECMKYDEYREKGYHIGSGAVESANKYLVQKRLKQAGMKWSFQGANAIVALRIHFLKNIWDDIWEPSNPIWAT